MEPEVLFIKYAFPCAFIIRQRREISDDEFSQLEQAAVENKVLPREFLEKVFFRAFERIEKLAAKMKKQRWDYDVIHEYFTKDHNKIIDQGMYSYTVAPDSLKELCKVHKGKIVWIDSETCVVQYNNKRRPVMRILIPEAKLGSKVTIHYGYAVELLE